MSGAAANIFATGAPRWRRPSPRYVRWLIVVVLVVLWEALPRAGLVPVLFLPPLSETLRAGLGDIGEYADALKVTLYEIAAAMVFACGGGIVAGAVIGGLPPLRRLLIPLASSLYAVPIVVLYPVFTAWLGIGPEAKICFAAVYGFFPTLLGTAAGIRTIDPHYLIAARSMGATLPQRVVRVIIPAAMPTVLSGLRLGGALVIVGVVVAEMLTSSAGVGYLISRYRTMLDSPHVFAAILLVLALAVAFDGAVKLVERRTAKWRFAGRRAREAEPDRLVADDIRALARTTQA
ncbi:MAG TPA: ABC transporter permease [Stellaceae bacterium]|jgi:NitT/TauT family transport system permease protein/taurine transport system permease protein